MLDKTLIIGGCRIHYYQSQDLDNKNIIVFLHGWGSEGKHFKPILDKQDNFIAIDMPGFGGSDSLKDVWTLDKYAEFLKIFLDKLKILNPILVGHSFGGSVLIKYCADGGKANKIILIGSAGIRIKTKKVKFYNILSKIIKPILLTPGIKYAEGVIKKKAYNVIGSQDYVSIKNKNLKNTFINIINQDLTEDMRKIDIDTFLIWGDNDMETPLSDGTLMNKLIKNSKLFIIKNAGHFAFLDKTEEFNKILKQILNK